MISQTPSGADANLNNSTKGSPIYLCVRYLSEGLHITNLLSIPQRQKEIPENAFRLRHTLSRRDAVLGQMSKHPYHLCFTKDWASLLFIPSSLRATPTEVSEEASSVVSPSVGSENYSVGNIPSQNFQPTTTSEDVPLASALSELSLENIPSEIITAESNSDMINPPSVVTTAPLSSSSPPPSPVLSSEIMLESIPQNALPFNGSCYAMETTDTLERVPSEIKVKPYIPDKDAIHNAAAQYRQVMRALLPLLVGCHCGEGTILQSCVESLHYFVHTPPVKAFKGYANPIVESILECIYGGALDVPALTNKGIYDILSKVLGVELVTQVTMVRLLKLFSALTVYLFNMEDNGLAKTHSYEVLFHNLHTIASVMSDRQTMHNQNSGEGMESTVKPLIEISAIKNLLEDYAFKLESPGALLAGEMTNEMLCICEQIGGCLAQQNTVLYLLVLLSDLRRFGRVSEVK